MAMAGAHSNEFPAQWAVHEKRINPIGKNAQMAAVAIAWFTRQTADVLSASRLLQ